MTETWGGGGGDRIKTIRITTRDWVSLSQILNKILDLAHAAIIIINLLVSHVPHDCYKPIACLIIKIIMIGNRNQMLRFPNGFHNTTVSWGKRVL